MCAASIVLAFSGSASAETAPSGKGVISVNLHRVGGSGCPGDALPSGLPASGYIDAISYHSNGDTSAQSTCRVNAALASSDYGKPKLIASDGGVWTNADASCWIDKVVRAQPTSGCTTDPNGFAAHYEHYERFFNKGACQDLALGCVASASSCNAFAYPQEGDTIAGVSTLPQCSAGTTSQALRTKLGNTASVVLPNGRLFRSARDFCWTWDSAATSCADPMRLMGYSWMGALTGLNFQLEAYLDALKGYGTNGINLTRVWAIEQWTAMQVECTSGCSPSMLTPFNRASGRYNLNVPNPVFYARLRALAQTAADRGVVVQLTLFDKHGLIKPHEAGRWQVSPYKRCNNWQDYYLLNALPGCPTACTACPAQSGVCDSCTKPRPDFIYWAETDPPIGAVHRAYLRNVAREVGGIGNVMLEIFNEARGDVDWPMADLEGFQASVAYELRRQLPTLTVRDAFNGESAPPGGLLLDGRSSDTGHVWAADNAEIVPMASNARYQLGRVVSEERLGVLGMSGSLPIPTNRRSYSVRANLSRSRGQIGIGLQDTGGALAVLYNGTTFSLVRRVGSATTTLGTWSAALAQPHVRLDADLVTGMATVYVDSERRFEVQVTDGIPTESGYFVGWVPNGERYLATEGAVDNFEVNVYSN